MIAALALLVLWGATLLFRPDIHAWRPAFVRAAIAVGAGIVLSTEMLSPFGALTRESILALWIAAAIAIWVTVLVLRRSRDTGMLIPPVSMPASALRRAEAMVLTLILGLTLVLALSAAPATWDSMTYHLSRVAHWIQNGTVEFYPTHIHRQLWMGPGAEFVVLQLQLLAGSDRVVPVIQWAAFAGVLVIASRIARQLGASSGGALLAALLAGTMPGAVAQASGTQVELLATLWMGCSISLILQLRRRPEDRWITTALLLGAAAGLAALTKATAYLFLAPFMLWLLVSAGRRSVRRAISLALLIAAGVLALNAPHAARNLRQYQNPLGISGAGGVTNGSLSGTGAVSNLIRNSVLHFGTPWAAVNDAVHAGVVRLHEAAGADPNSRQTTFGRERFRPVRLETTEQSAGSPLHFIAALAATLVVLLRRRSMERDTRLYLLGVVAGFVLFTIFLRWQPWHARLHVPLLLLSAPALAAWLDPRLGPRARAGLLALLVLGVLPALLLNPARRVLPPNPVWSVPRLEQYFADQPSLYRPYRNAAERVAESGCRDVGLSLGSDDYEYPLWVLLTTRTGDPVRIRHVGVPQQSGAAQPVGLENFPVCAVIIVGAGGGRIPIAFGPPFDRQWEEGPVRVYIRGRGGGMSRLRPREKSIL